MTEATDETALRCVSLAATDAEGGAARAAVRLHLGLRRVGVASRVVVQSGGGSAPEVYGPASARERIVARLRPHADRLPLQLRYGRPRRSWSPAWAPRLGWPRRADLQADVIQLHWVTGGFLSVRTIGQLGAPIVWTLHDAWPFTGGCHLPGDCERFVEQCGACPLLGSSRDRDASRSGWARKRRAWEGRDMTFVAPSRWMADQARRSSLLRDRRIEVIPNGLDLEVFKPLDRAFARQALNLPATTRLLLFGAAGAFLDPDKGGDDAFAVARAVAEEVGDVELVAFGGRVQDARAEAGAVRVHHRGVLHDDWSLALLYAAADVFLVPTRFDNLPYVVMEAMACGTPCVAYRVGGLSDLIDDGDNGRLVEPGDHRALCRAVVDLLKDRDRASRLGEAARAKTARCFGLETVARRYEQLYRELAGGPPR